MSRTRPGNVRSATAIVGCAFSLAVVSCNSTYGTVPQTSSPRAPNVARSAHGSKAAVIYTFKGKHGAFPYSSLIADENGALYGTTLSGGTSNHGTVYKLAPTKGGGPYTETVLYNFKDESDGAAPVAALLLVNHKELYGTTTSGGDLACGSAGCGTVFGLTTSGRNFHVLHTFRGAQDGSTPKASLIVDDGSLFGTTEYGGSSACGGTGCGTIFELTPSDGAPKYGYTLLYAFTGGSGGQFPVSALFINDDKNFLGTTTSGGDMSACGGNGCGTIYGILYAGSSWEFFVFNTFEGGATDGADRESGLVEANPKPGSQGGTYPYVGTTTLGGPYNLGTVYEIWGGNACGKKYTFCEKLIYPFTPGNHNAASPSAGNLVMGATGVLYGTSTAGGTHKNGGTAYKLTPHGSIGPSGPPYYSEDVFFDFGGAFGTSPAAGLLLNVPGKSSALFGTTSAGAS